MSPHPAARILVLPRPRPSAHRPSFVRAALVACLLTLLLAVPPASGNSAGSWPLAPRPEVVAGFDPPTTPWGAGHRGVDLLGTAGQPVRAGLGGTVAYAGLLAGKGVVVVRHGSTRTTYEPVAAVVAVGDPVAPGDLLGHLDPGGSHCPPRTCLHWGLIEETLDGDVYRDPLTLVGGGPVRLLPWAGLGPASPSVRPSPPAAPRAPGRSVQARGWAWR